MVSVVHVNAGKISAETIKLVTKAIAAETMYRISNLSRSPSLISPLSMASFHLRRYGSVVRQKTPKKTPRKAIPIMLFHQIKFRA